MGWVLYFYSDFTSNYGSKLAPADTVDDFPGVSTVYLRCRGRCWSRGGQVQLGLLDTPAQRWIAKGKRVAFRVTCSESMIRHATPEWVEKAGAKGHSFLLGAGRREDGPLWDPDFADPVFLAKLENFLKAMAARYDGNPNVAFIDVGSFGLWGEGHTHASSQVPPAEAREIVRKHIDLHRKLFPRTQLAISDDVAGHDKPGARFPETDYALANNVALRDDSILIWPPPQHWYHAEMAQAFWPKLPVILEHDHMGESQIRKAWDGDRLLEAVEAYHASYLSIHWWPREFLEANRDAIDRINRRLGLPLAVAGDRLAEAGRDRQAIHRAVRLGQRRRRTVPAGRVRRDHAEGREGRDRVGAGGRGVRRAVAEGRRRRTRADEVARTRVHGRPDRAGDAAGRVRSLRLRRPADGTPTIALPLPGDDGQRRYKSGGHTESRR